MFYSRMDDTPVGPLLLAGDETGLKHVLFSKRGELLSADPDWVPDDRRLQEVTKQLTAYFRGRLQQFELSLAPEGTDFQLAVWRQLSCVPFGTTASYGQIAEAIGRPTASRAVGMANGRNPLPIIVPCHRIIGSSGKLVGYGGGLERKFALLQLEGIDVAEEVGLIPAG